MARTFKNDENIQRVPKGQTHPYVRWEDTPLWEAVEKAVADLVQNRDLVEDEYHEYIVGYIRKIIDRRKKRQSSLSYGAGVVPNRLYTATALNNLTAQRPRSFPSVQLTHALFLLEFRVCRV